METLENKIKHAEKHRGKITYELSNGYFLEARYSLKTKIWAMNYYANDDANFPKWDSDKVFSSFDDVIQFIVKCELECIQAYKDYLNKFCCRVIIETVPNFVREQVESNIKFWNC